MSMDVDQFGAQKGYVGQDHNENLLSVQECDMVDIERCLVADTMHKRAMVHGHRTLMQAAVWT